VGGSLGSPATLLTILAVALVAYAVLATAVVEGGWLVTVDHDVSEWVGRSMPAWAEWLARPFSWVGGWVGASAVGVTAFVWLLGRGDRAAAVLLAFAAVGSQFLVSTGKVGYDRPRPTAGSPVDVPSSFSFPSGHATTGAALFGALGLVVARHVPDRLRVGVAVGGFVLGALVAASRVVLNVHFLSDVLAGAALGLSWLAVCLLAPDVVAWGRRRYADRS
jgi:undecaprenyl-diphosphatase